MGVRHGITAMMCIAAAACSGATSGNPVAPPRSGAAAASATPHPVKTSPRATSAAPEVRWPKAPAPSPPQALGAYRTRRVTAHSGGGTLAAGLVLPRIGGTVAGPRVLTPCGRQVTISAADADYLRPGSGGRLPKSRDTVTVVIDAGHGGRARGAEGPRGTDEAVRNLEIAREVRRALAGRVARVVMTRDRDMEATLGYRVAVADSLYADAAVSVHLNAEPDGPRATPGLETYGSVAHPAGRRFAGVMYAAQRRYLDSLDGPWVGDRDAGAKYRTGRNGRDYYGLLRRAHVPWVISESMFISATREEALVAQPAVRRDLGRAIADGVLAFTQTAQPGSGWVRPYARPPNPTGPDPVSPCVDPAR